MSIATLQNIQRIIYYDTIGGPKLIKMKYIVNLFKGATAFYIVFLMSYYQNFSLGMYTYLALHGSYGMIWVLKDVTFGDKSFDEYSTIPSNILCALLLTSYWMMAWFIASGYGINQPTFLRIKVCVLIYLIGLTLMIGTDAQKTFTLQYKKGLISSGFNSRIRNPNYFGEMMIYGSFAILSGFWISYVIVVTVWIVLFGTNMAVKESSLKKKIGWTEYSSKSYLVIPRLFQSHTLNLISYAIIIGIMVAKYKGLTIPRFL